MSNSGQLFERAKASARYRSTRALQAGVQSALSLTKTVWGEDAAPMPFLRRAWWKMTRSYAPPAQTLPPARMAEFNDIVARIAEGAMVSQSELLPFLSLGLRDQRVTVNAMLADAYCHLATPERLKQSRIFLERAWLLSNFDSELLPFYLKLLCAEGDIAAIREAYKRAGIAAAQRGRANEALQFFNASHYADHQFRQVDHYKYDFDILNCVDGLAAPYRYSHDQPLPELNGEKIRIAWLAKDLGEINSILIKIDLELVKFRDRERFEIQIFSPDQRNHVLESPQGRDHIRQFESLGCPVTTAEDSDDTLHSLLDLAERIYTFQPHILVTSAALADFKQYFITSLKVAPIQVGLVQGPPPQFAPPTLDWCIVWTRHPLIDCPIDCSWIQIFLDWPRRDDVVSFSRSELNLPEEACVLLSGGRHTKFQSLEFWNCISDVLAENPNAWFVVVGSTEDQILAPLETLPENIRRRIRCLGWREDFLRILATADIVIDTYPNGGGQVIVQAMSMSIPVAAHRNDYFRPFDQNDWSPVEDFLNEPDLLVDRGDFSRFTEILNKLIRDPEYRRDAGHRCREQHVRQVDPATTVRRCEEVYTQLYQRYSAKPFEPRDS